jgi:hypothetical protein
MQTAVTIDNTDMQTSSVAGENCGFNSACIFSQAFPFGLPFLLAIGALAVASRVSLRQLLQPTGRLFARSSRMCCEPEKT